MYACIDRDYTVIVTKCHTYTFWYYWWDLLLSAHQNDPVLKSSIQALAGKVLELAPGYFEAETKAMVTSKNNIHFVKELEDYLKKRP
jgi:hypothetical protein